MVVAGPLTRENAVSTRQGLGSVHAAQRPTEGTTMRGAEKEQTRVKRRAKKWAKALGLDGWWRISYQFMEQVIGEDTEAQAKTVADWKLREATVNFHLEETVVLDDEDLDNLVVHELVHLMIAPHRAEGEGRPDGGLVGVRRRDRGGSAAARRCLGGRESS